MLLGRLYDETMIKKWAIASCDGPFFKLFKLSEEQDHSS